MLLKKAAFQLLREADTSFTIKPHQKHYFFVLNFKTPKYEKYYQTLI